MKLQLNLSPEEVVFLLKSGIERKINQIGKANKFKATLRDLRDGQEYDLETLPWMAVEVTQEEF